MNNTSNTTKISGSYPGNQTGGDIGYTIGVCVGVVITVMIMITVSYFFKRRSNALRGAVDATIGNDSAIITINRDGIDENALSSYPTFTYVQLEPCKSDSTALGCCICLADYKETDFLRLLPDCGHMFHLKCVDPWLMIHSTCPICRNSPLVASLAPAVQIDVHE